MSENNFYDPLANFHLHNPDTNAYARIAHLVSILDRRTDDNTDWVIQNISNILGEAESGRILQLICEKSHLNQAQLISHCQQLTTYKISPRLLLHIACLPTYFVADKLQIDEDRVMQLLNELRKIFTIDDPILWLKRLLSQTEKEQLFYERSKEELLHGLAVVNQPVDTAEERKLRERKLKPRPITDFGD